MPTAAIAGSSILICAPARPIGCRSSALQMNDPASCRVRDRVGAAGGIELLQQRSDVDLRGVDRYSELLCDGLVRGAFRQQGEHVELPWRQVEAVELDAAGSMARDDRNRC